MTAEGYAVIILLGLPISAALWLGVFFGGVSFYRDMFWSVDDWKKHYATRQRLAGL